MGYSGAGVYASHWPVRLSTPDLALGVFLLALFSHTCLPASAGPVVILILGGCF